MIIEIAKKQLNKTSVSGKKQTPAGKKYEQKLRSKFGISNLVGKYRGERIPVAHKCQDCGADYDALPCTMLHWKTHQRCSDCSVRAQPRAGKRTSKELFAEEVAEKFENIHVLEYKSKGAFAKFACSCGNTWKVVAKNVFAYKRDGCPKCCKRLAGHARSGLTSQSVKKILAVRGIKLLQPYVGQLHKLHVKCLKCFHKWTPIASNVLGKRHSGCPMCNRSRMRRTARQVVIGARTVLVDGYEPYAIEWLKRQGTPEKKIRVFSEGVIQSIPYRFQGKEKQFWPDIQIGERIVEVKSDFTLFDQWKMNCAKGAAAAKRGKFDLLVAYADGEVIQLPKNWFKQSLDTIDNFLYMQRNKNQTTRILAVDPGTTNAAWSVVEVTVKGETTLIAHGMFKQALTQLASGQSSMSQLVLDKTQFTYEFEDLVLAYKPQGLVMERYMTRGVKGTTIELVNIMIGVMMEVFTTIVWKNPRIQVMPASQWKNAWNKQDSLEDFYEIARPCTNHQIDATGIGLYAAAKWSGKVPFEWARSKHSRIEMAKALIKTNTE